MQKNSLIIGIVVALLLIGGVGWYLTARKASAPANENQTTETGAMEEENNRASSGADNPTDAMEDKQGNVMENTTTSGSAMDESSKADAMTDVQVKSFTIKGSNFKFEPSTITVNKGDTVKVTFENVGGFHDWVLEEFNVRTKQIGNGTTETVQFVADRTGSFEYYCSVGSHRQMGMKGTLIVK